MDLGTPTSGPDSRAGQSAEPREGAAAAPHKIASNEEPTRPIRISATLDLAAASASVVDEESRRPTGEVPSIGHEVRAKAPDQRVHTSPTGNILPSEVLQTLDAAVAANRSASGSAASAGATAARATPAEPGSSARSSGRDSKHGSERPGERSGSLDRPGQSLPGPADVSPRSGERAGERARVQEPERRGERPEERLRGAPESRSERRAPRNSPRPRRALSAISAATPGQTRSQTDAEVAGSTDRPPADAAPNAPIAVGFEPTHLISRRRPGAQLMRAVRTFMWALLCLGIGGVVAFTVVVLYRRGQPARPAVPAAASPAPARRAAPAPPKTTPGPAAPRGPASGAAAPPVSSTRARDLVVPIPASLGRPPAPVAALRGHPGTAAPLPAPAAPAPGAAPAAPAPETPGPLASAPAGAAAGLQPPAALPESPPAPPPAPPLDPQQQAAAEQTMSNIEFVVSERVAQVRACYDRAVRSTGPEAPAGRIEMSLTLTDEGQPSRISTTANTVGIPQLAGCLEQRIAEWRFPRPLGTARTFPLRFAFSPSPQQSGPRSRR